jgi:glycosyltransferase involved in cell wall biosynthesis
MPIYNEERFIGETLKSVLSQDYPNFEVIISENCSSDSTLEIVTSIAEMDSRVKIIRTSETVLSSANGKNAFLNSNGQFFIWVFGHDLLEPSYIRKCFDLFQENPNIILAYSRAAFIDMQGRRIALCPGIDTRGCDPLSRFFKVMWGIQYGYPQYGMMRRKILEEFMLKEPNKLPASDYLFLAELACLGEFAQVDEVLFNIRRMDDFGSWEHYMKKHLLIKQGASPVDIFLKMVREFNAIIERRLSSSGIVPYLSAALISCLYTKHVGILAGMLNTSIGTQNDRDYAERIMSQLAEASRQLTHIGLGLVPNMSAGSEIFKQTDDSTSQNDASTGNSAKQKDLAVFYDSLQQGEQLYSEGNVVEAMRCFTNIIKGTDNESIRCQAFNNIGVIAHGMNDMKKAEQMFRSALSADSVNIDALINLSELYITNGLHDEASKIIEKALISYPGNAQFTERLSLCRNVLRKDESLEHGENHRLTEDTLPVHSMVQVSRPKTIIVDGVFFQMYRTGIARVWKSLLTQWAKTSFAQTLLVLDRNGTFPHIDGLRYRQIGAYDYNNTDADRAMLQKVCEEESASIFISTYYTTPLTTPSVFMGYDMIPEIAGWDTNIPMWREKHYGIRHAVHYILISQNTANDLRRFFPDIAPSQITVAHTGVDFSLPPKDAVKAFKNQFGIKKPYWLLVGGRGGYKNGILFFRAFERLGNLRKNFAIVCTGPTGALEAEYAACTGNADVFTLDLSDENLQAAYAAAIALVYPSLYEGFGMPIIEAMACGCPVITSPSGSIPEVAGDAALMVNSGNVDDMLNAMKKVQKPKLRHVLIDRGIRRSQLYSWEKMADEVKNVLLRVAAEK